LFAHVINVAVVGCSADVLMTSAGDAGDWPGSHYSPEIRERAHELYSNAVEMNSFRSELVHNLKRTRSR